MTASNSASARLRVSRLCSAGCVARTQQHADAQRHRAQVAARPVAQHRDDLRLAERLCRSPRCASARGDVLGIVLAAAPRQWSSTVRMMSSKDCATRCVQARSPERWSRHGSRPPRRRALFQIGQPAPAGLCARTAWRAELRHRIDRHAARQRGELGHRRGESARGRGRAPAHRGRRPAPRGGRKIVGIEAVRNPQARRIDTSARERSWSAPRLPQGADRLRS